ncbi:phasin family protein [Zavarzinia sp. CC-PAN008]|uniref:phasin family protein n=1 Tax=Zavarzinia sp. CC-PAN008 TaxID=3243332 RepID=UPI003F7465FB
MSTTTIDFNPTKLFDSAAFEKLAEPLKGLGETLKGVRERALEQNQEINTRVIAIAEQNAAQYFDAARAAAKAKTLTELLEVQNGFARESLARNVAQFKELSELFTNASRTTWAPLGAILTPKAA